MQRGLEREERPTGTRPISQREGSCPPINHQATNCVCCTSNSSTACTNNGRKLAAEKAGKQGGRRHPGFCEESPWIKSVQRVAGLTRWRDLLHVDWAVVPWPVFSRCVFDFHLFFE